MLRETWPTLEPIDAAERDTLRRAHGAWRDDVTTGQRRWVEFVLGDLLGWRDDLRWADSADLTALAVDRPEHDTTVSPSFVLAEPGSCTEPGARAGEVKPTDVRLLGLLCDPGQQPTARIPGSAWAATPVDRVAQLCRHHDVPLGLVTDGRWWALVRAPRGDVTSARCSTPWPGRRQPTATWCGRSARCWSAAGSSGCPTPSASLRCGSAAKTARKTSPRPSACRFARPSSCWSTAIGRADLTVQGESLRNVTAHEVYRGAVSVMMRVVFLLFAEERRLLPSDNELYAQSYSAGRLGASWSSGRARARRTSWRTPPPPGTGCSRCSPPCTTGSSTRA